MKNADPKHLATRLDKLAEDMLEVGTMMDYYGGFADSSDNGRKLAYASGLVKSWADEMTQKQPVKTEHKIKTGTITQQGGVTRHVMR